MAEQARRESVKAIMRRALWAALLVIVTGLGVAIVRQGMPDSRQPSMPLLPAGARVVPYTVTLRATVTDGAGRKIERGPETLALRSDGASVRAFHDGAGTVRHVRFVDGVVAELKDAFRGKSTIYRPIVDSWILDPAQDCARNVFGQMLRPSPIGGVSIEAISGYRAARITTGYTTRWFALDHGCALIRQSREIPTGQVSLLELVSLEPGEPDHALFAVPASYAEGAPSTFMPPPAEPCNARCQENHRNYRAALDKNYSRNTRPRSAILGEFLVLSS